MIQSKRWCNVRFVYHSHSALYPCHAPVPYPPFEEIGTGAIFLTKQPLSLIIENDLVFGQVS
jgi:hypothetical protein